MKNNLNLQYKLPIKLVPTPYPLYIKSNNGRLPGLVSLDSPSGTAANHPHAMDRRNYGLRCSLVLVVSKVSRDIVRNKLTIPNSLSSTGIFLNKILIPLLISE